MALTPIAERLARELSLPVLRLKSVAAGNTEPSACQANALTDYATAAVIVIIKNILIYYLFIYET